MKKMFLFCALVAQTVSIASSVPYFGLSSFLVTTIVAKTVLETVIGESVFIKQLTEEKLQDFKEIYLATVASCPQHFLISHEELCKKTDAYWKDKIKSVKIFIACCQQEVVGVVVVRYNSLAKIKHHCFVEIVFVEEMYRHKGIGTQLLTEAKKQAASVGISQMFTSIDTQNVAAERWLKNNGFLQEGVQRDCFKLHDGTPCDRSTFRCDLD